MVDYHVNNVILNDDGSRTYHTIEYSGRLYYLKPFILPPLEEVKKHPFKDLSSFLFLLSVVDATGFQTDSVVFFPDLVLLKNYNPQCYQLLSVDEQRI